MHPDWQDRVVHELTAAPEIIPTMAAIKLHWPCLWSCLQETLRLYPPVWSVGRIVQTETSIDSYKVPAGSTLIISPWLQQHHSELWTNVEKFLPERFSEEANPSAGRFLPFGSGSHGCPGETFARQTICILVAEWLRTWRFVPAPHAPMPQPMLGLTQRPHPGVFLRLERRS
jgi:cytochrome P450